jgi:hypothetical protein
MLTFVGFFRFREFDSHVTSQSPAKRVPTADSSKLSWSATELCSTAKCATSSGCYEQSTRCGLWPRSVPAYRGRCEWTGNLDRQQHFNVHPDDATPRSQESPPELLYTIKTWFHHLWNVKIIHRYKSFNRAPSDTCSAATRFGSPGRSVLATCARILVFGCLFRIGHAG